MWYLPYYENIYSLLFLKARVWALNGNKAEEFGECKDFRLWNLKTRVHTQLVSDHMTSVIYSTCLGFSFFH